MLTLTPNLVCYAIRYLMLDCRCDPALCYVLDCWEEPSLSPVVLKRTLSHMWLRLYLPIFWLGVGLFTLMKMDSLEHFEGNALRSATNPLRYGTGLWMTHGSSNNSPVNRHSWNTSIALIQQLSLQWKVLKEMGLYHSVIP